jgi:hypothetical protein
MTYTELVQGPRDRESAERFVRVGWAPSFVLYLERED